MIGFLCVATTLYGWDAFHNFRLVRDLEAPAELTTDVRWVATGANTLMFGWGLTLIFWS